MTQTVAEPPPAILCGACDHSWHEGRCKRWGCRCERVKPPQARQETAVVSETPLAGLCVLVSMHEERRRQVARMLVALGWEVLPAWDYDEAITMLADTSPQLVVVDALGHRKPGTTLVQFLAWLGHKHKAAGFGVVYLGTPGLRRGKVGALGPIVRKPVNPAHLAIAVDSVARQPFCVDGMRLDLTRSELSGPTGTQHVTYLESRLLAYLTSHSGEVVTSDKLLIDVWDYVDTVGSSTTVRAHMSNLRKKLRQVGVPDAIRTYRRTPYRGNGYGCDLVIPVVG